MESRRRRLCLVVGKWSLYVLLLMLCAVLQTTPYLFQIASVKPIFILPLCLAVAIYEGEFAGSLFGVVGGLMWDYTAGVVVGIFAILLLLLCFGVSLGVQMYLRCTKFNYFLVCLGANLIALSTHFMFFYYMPGYQDPWYQYGTMVVPMAFYSALFAIPLFLAVRQIAEHICVIE